MSASLVYEESTGTYVGSMIAAIVSIVVGLIPDLIGKYTISKVFVANFDYIHIDRIDVIEWHAYNSSHEREKLSSSQHTHQDTISRWQSPKLS